MLQLPPKLRLSRSKPTVVKAKYQILESLACFGKQLIWLQISVQQHEVRSRKNVALEEDVFILIVDVPKHVATPTDKQPQTGAAEPPAE